MVFLWFFLRVPMVILRVPMAPLRFPMVFPRVSPHLSRSLREVLPFTESQPALRAFPVGDVRRWERATSEDEDLYISPLSPSHLYNPTKLDDDWG